MIDFHISTILKPMVFMHFFQIFICIIFSDFDFYSNWYIFLSAATSDAGSRFSCHTAWGFSVIYFFTKFLIFLELSQYIACGERPQQREGFQWHILAPRKTRSDLGRRDPVKAPNLRDLRKWKWIVLAQQPQQRESESAIVTKLNVKVWLWIQVKVIKSKIFEKHIQCIAMSMIT